MQSGFDPPPPPDGKPSADPFAPPPLDEPVAPHAPQQPPQPYPQQQQQQPYQGPPGYAQQPWQQPNPYAQQHYPGMPGMPPNYVQPAPGYGGGYGGYGYLVPTDGKATASLVLGLVSLFCMGALTGIPAIIFGFLARRDIARSGGQLQGSGLALGGIIIGSLATLLSVVTFGFMAFGALAAKHAASTMPTGYPTPTFVIPTPPPTPTATGATASTTMHGNLKVVSLGGGRPLQDQLEDLRSTELALGRTTIVETTASWCGPCTEIASTFDDPLVQRALDQVTLVEVDIDEFGAELSGLKMQTNAIPYFYKIDSVAHATDAISGDEWDENTPANEAPVLGAFAKGTLKKRRHPSTVGTAL